MKNLRLILVTGGFIMSLSASGREIIAHRGASYNAPENTLSAFKLGCEERADADELDIHLTKDGKVVVMHDFDTGRTSGVTNKIVEHTFEELRRLDVGKLGQWKGKEV